MTLPHWHRPGTLGEAVALRAALPGALAIAGGTDVMVELQAGRVTPADVLDLSRLDELRGIALGPDGARIGALATYADIASHAGLRDRYPLLPAAARESGAPAIQNRGTLGGNLANASPAADSPPGLLAYGATLELVGPRGVRRLAYTRFHLGYRRVALEPDELIAAVLLPPALPPGTVHFYRKVGPRRAQAISKVALAAVGRVERGTLAAIGVGLASVAPTPLEAPTVIRYLEGRAAAAVDRSRARAALERDLAPIDDLRSTAAYRRRVAGNLLEAFLDALGVPGALAA